MIHTNLLGHEYLFKIIFWDWRCYGSAVKSSCICGFHSQSPNVSVQLSETVILRATSSSSGFPRHWAYGAHTYIQVNTDTHTMKIFKIIIIMFFFLGRIPFHQGISSSFTLLKVLKDRCTIYNIYGTPFSLNFYC